MKHIKSKNEHQREIYLTDIEKKGYNFTDAEIDRLITDCTNIGFEVMNYRTTDKSFNKSKVNGEINFNHIKTNNMLTLHKYELNILNLDILKDNIADIFFTSLYKQLDDKDYADNYDPS